MTRRRDPAQPGFESAQSGFTLMEMMVVMAIIVIAASFMVPSLLDHLKKRRLKNAGNLIVSTLNEARSEAVTKRKRLSVCFVQDGVYIYDPKERSFKTKLRRYSKDRLVTYRLLFKDEESKNTDYEERPLGLLEGDELNDVDLSPDDIVLHFEPTGTIDFGSNNDVSSDRFNKSEGADIVLDQAGEDYTKGFIDIRAAGMIAFKIEELGLEE